jgi:hypothetical protein
VGAGRSVDAAERLRDDHAPPGGHLRHRRPVKGRRSSPSGQIEASAVGARAISGWWFAASSSPPALFVTRSPKATTACRRSFLGRTGLQIGDWAMPMVKGQAGGVPAVIARSCQAPAVTPARLGRPRATGLRRPHDCVPRPRRTRPPRRAGARQAPLRHLTSNLRPSMRLEARTRSEVWPARLLPRPARRWPARAAAR